MGYRKTVFDHVFDALEFLNLPIIDWPRPLRRVYMLTWPVAVVLRYAVWVLAAVVVLFTGAVLIVVEAGKLFTVKTIKEDIVKNWEAP